MDSSKTEDNIKLEYHHNSLYKIGLFGDSEVGKTSIISKYLTGKVKPFPMSTLTMEFAIKLIEIKEGGYIKTQIWDTPGRTQYREMTFHNINKFIGGIIIYDITKRSTFDNVPLWTKIFRTKCEKNSVICLVGNKLDKIEKQKNLREVSKEEAETFAFLNHMLFFETSIYYDDFDNIFDELIQNIYNEKRKFLNKSDISHIVDDSSYFENYNKKENRCYEIKFENNNMDNLGCKCDIF